MKTIELSKYSDKLPKQVILATDENAVLGFWDKDDATFLISTIESLADRVGLHVLTSILENESLTSEEEVKVYAAIFYIRDNAKKEIVNNGYYYNP